MQVVVQQLFGRKFLFQYADGWRIALLQARNRNTLCILTAGSALRVYQFFQFRGAATRRFLHEHGFSAFQHLLRNGIMGLGACSNEHSPDFRILQHSIQVGGADDSTELLSYEGRFALRSHTDVL